MAIKILGVMTGTSCDGLDAACIDISTKSWRMLWSHSVDFDAALRKRVHEIQRPGTQASILTWLELDRDLGLWYGKVLRQLIARHREKPDFIANHGQTVAHFPDSQVTLQIGDPTVVARACGTSVISHFRNGDMAAGGQGAPLLPRFHAVVARAFTKKSGIAIHNLGGISNLTYLAPDGEILAFDTGPANMFIDLAVQEHTGGKEKFDRSGKIAAASAPDAADLARLLAHPFFARGFPKSTGRDDFTAEWFSAHALSRGAIRVATATALTAESVALAYHQLQKKRKKISEIYFAGGGAKNPFLLSEIARLLPDIKITSLESLAIEPQMIEAQGFAIFGYLSLLGLPIGGSWTGARGFAPPGHIIPGENWKSAMKKLERALSAGLPKYLGTK